VKHTCVAHTCAWQDGHVSSECPKLLGEEAFYSDVRRRVRGYFKSIGLDKVCPGPTRQCVALFWLVFLAWAAGLLCLLLITPTIPTAVLCGVLASFLGAFGHNWIHQPDYKHYAYLSLDLIGFSSDGWYREHLLQHHMYTNTPLDNHFKGTDPFIVTDPTVARNWFQSHLSPLLNPLFLTCGLWGNYTAHLVEILKGNEKFVLWKLFLPSLVYTFYRAHGGFGLILMYFYAGTMGIYYFTMALMNHNSEKTLNVGLRNTADDWGKAQIVSCADWAVQVSVNKGGRCEQRMRSEPECARERAEDALHSPFILRSHVHTPLQTPFLPSIIYLWLNYHCVHHLFPLVDFSHHRPVQKILMETCRDHGVVYEAGEFWDIYRQMVKGFATPSSLFKEINAYNGS